MEPVKLGIIGCGIAANDLHWPALKKLSNQFSIVCVCNHTRPKAEQFARKVGGVDFVLDYRELLTRPDVEAVDIVLPIHLNYQVAKDALEAGKHVLVEKPLAATLSQAEQLRQLERDTSLVTMVAENYRYRPLYRKVAELLEKKIVGEPFATTWTMAYRVTPENNKYARTTWRQKHQYPGGFITDGGVHNIAVFRFLLGEIISGSAIATSVNPEIGELDSFIFHFETEQKVLGDFQVFFSAVGLNENKLKIFGKKGTLEIQGQTITIYNEEKKETLKIEDDGGYEEQFRDFYRAIRFQKAPISSFEQGYRDLKTLLAAQEAASNGTVFRLEWS